MEKIKIAICGYGELGKYVEKALSNPANQDMELVAIFTTSRDSQTITSVSDVDIISIDDIERYMQDIEVVILCGDSGDLLEYGPRVAKCFDTVDSFDKREEIMEYLKRMDDVTLWAGSISIVSVGLDLAAFSMARGCAEAIMPKESIGSCKDPEYTASFLVAYARAAVRLAEDGETGIKTILDVPTSLLTDGTTEDLFERLLNE